MPRYVVLFKDEVVSELDSDAPTIRIGRSEDCELRIDNLGISRYHAVIEQQDGVRSIKDLGSHNGVYYNGKPVKTRVLNHGDVFVIGKYRLEYSDLQQEQAAADAPPPRVEVDPAAGELGKTFAIDPTALAHLQQAERVKGFLRRVEDGKQIDLRQTITTFGKDERCDHRLPGGLFSPRILALVVRDERGFIVVNTTGNPNRVQVENRPLSMYVRLENGFKLRLGRVDFTFHSGKAVD